MTAEQWIGLALALAAAVIFAAQPISSWLARNDADMQALIDDALEPKRAPRLHTDWETVLAFQAQVEQARAEMADDDRIWRAVL